MELKTKEINGAECLYYNPSGLQKESTYDFRKNFRVRSIARRTSGLEEAL